VNKSYSRFFFTKDPYQESPGGANILEIEQHLLSRASAFEPLEDVIVRTANPKNKKAGPGLP